LERFDGNRVRATGAFGARRASLRGIRYGGQRSRWPPGARCGCQRRPERRRPPYAAPTTPRTGRTFFVSDQGRPRAARRFSHAKKAYSVSRGESFMLRISHYLRALARPDAGPVLGARGTPGTRPPVVIWNLLRRCNLTCKHCYATSADSEFRDELDTTEALRVIDDLHAAGVKVLILSGGEPLLREDIFEL